MIYLNDSNINISNFKEQMESVINADKDNNIVSIGYFESSIQNGEFVSIEPLCVVIEHKPSDELLDAIFLAKDLCLEYSDSIADYEEEEGRFTIVWSR